MAGRGKSATLPAWMTQQSLEGVAHVEQANEVSFRQYSIFNKCL